MGKPTIEELEALLDGKESDVVIMPNGEIKMACKNCLRLKERIDELETQVVSQQDQYTRLDKPRPIDQYRPTGCDSDGKEA